MRKKDFNAHLTKVLPVLKCVPHVIRKEMLYLAVIEKLKRNTIITVEGHLSPHFYLVLSGELNVFRTLKEGAIPPKDFDKYGAYVRDGRLGEVILKKVCNMEMPFLIGEE